jgi:hypothetical protein
MKNNIKKGDDSLPPLPEYPEEDAWVRHVDRWGYHWANDGTFYVFWNGKGWYCISHYFRLTGHRLPKSWTQPGFFVTKK